MEITRADTARTMASRTLSTSELGRGLSHILMDASMVLPDDPMQLQDPYFEGWSLCYIMYENV